MKDISLFVSKSRSNFCITTKRAQALVYKLLLVSFKCVTGISFNYFYHLCVVLPLEQLIVIATRFE